MHKHDYVSADTGTPGSTTAVSCPTNLGKARAARAVMRPAQAAICPHPAEMRPSQVATCPAQTAINPKDVLHVLWCAGRFPNKAHSQKQIFMQSLICNVSPDAQLLHCCDDQSQLQSQGRQHASRRAAACQANVGPSPCPALDAFVASACNQVHLLQCKPLNHPPLCCTAMTQSDVCFN